MLFVGESLQFYLVCLILSFMHTTRLHKYFAVSFYRLNDIHDDDGDTGFILEVGQLGSNGFPSVILGSPFSRNGVQERGNESKKKKKTECFLRLVTFYMGQTCRTLCRHFGIFWATEKAWTRITAESRMFVWWNNDSNEEEKGKWDSKRL